jgi:DNA-binding transcriptional regulator LsrR (DeoR family)
LLPHSGIVAIGGGRSVADVVQRLRRGDVRRLTVVQAMGSIDSNISPVDALELGRALVALWGGEFLTLSTPAFAPDKKTRDSFLGSSQIRSVWQRLRKADAALVGVGALQQSVYIDRGVLNLGDIAHLRSCGAAGEICGRFFDDEGRECNSRWRNRAISIELDHLRKIPQVIGVAAGPDRAPAVVAAMRGGLLKSLLIDESGALALLAM